MNLSSNRAFNFIDISRVRLDPLHESTSAFGSVSTKMRYILSVIKWWYLMNHKSLAHIKMF